MEMSKKLPVQLRYNNKNILKSQISEARFNLQFLHSLFLFRMPSFLTKFSELAIYSFSPVSFNALTRSVSYYTQMTSKCKRYN
jgi:hypothetical protein